MIWPIVLPHDQIGLILNRNATLLILTRTLKPGRYDIEDSLIARRNQRHRKDGRPHLQTEPIAFAIEISSTEKALLLDLDLITVRRTGNKTLEEFYTDWLSRRRRIQVDLQVHLHTFRIAEDARYLHAKIHRAYTQNPAEAVDGEQQALSHDEQIRISRAAFDRDDLIRRERVKTAHREAQDAVHRLSDAVNGDRSLTRTVRALNHHLASFERKL